MEPSIVMSLLSCRVGPEEYGLGWLYIAAVVYGSWRLGHWYYTGK